MESVAGYLSLVKTVNSLPANKIHLPAAIRRISYLKSVKFTFLLSVKVFHGLQKESKLYVQQVNPLQTPLFPVFVLR